MAGIPVSLRMGKISLDSGGTPLVIKIEENGDFKFTPPEIDSRFIQDRGMNTSLLVNTAQEQVAWSFTCKCLDDQTVSDIRSLLDGTNHMTYEIDPTASKWSAKETHTFYYVKGTCEYSEDEEGANLSVSGTAQGWSDGSATYGLTS